MGVDHLHQDMLRHVIEAHAKIHHLCHVCIAKGDRKKETSCVFKLVSQNRFQLKLFQPNFFLQNCRKFANQGHRFLITLVGKSVSDGIYVLFW